MNTEILLAFLAVLLPSEIIGVCLTALGIRLWEMRIAELELKKLRGRQTIKK